MKLPAAFITKYQQLLGDEADAFFAAFDEPVEKGFRINPNKAVTPAMQAKMTDPIAYSKIGYYGKVNGNALEHLAGAVYSQEPSAMTVGEVARPALNERVLDLCAAPGGKTTHLLSYLQQTGLLVTNEINPKRVTALGDNVERYGARNAVITNESPAHLAKAFPGFFDRILVDAPCSGEGMFRKDPDAMQYWSTDYPAECATRQREILTETVKMLRPGGHLIYSTCTFAPEEDEQMMAWLLETYPEFELEPIEKVAGMVDAKPEWADGNPELKKAARLFPHLMRGEGHFIAKLVYRGTTKPKNLRTVRDELKPDQRKLWEQAQKQLQLPNFNDLALQVHGDQLYGVPELMPMTRKLKVFRSGIHLGTFKKKRFEPSYALALASDDLDLPKLAITHDQWATYVHGETFDLDVAVATNGFMVLTCDDLPVGFGKAVGRTVKNFFPKGLRFLATDDKTVL
ncbi:RsmB/NOP family class I SAM-dependent RNA methyltransferase [Lactiplantibacillus mudanjiangensis]|uniref:RNA methyltransferase [Lactobacillus sp.] n=1 Tax=Lactiplantibacillus mudanjiangensis TaxID=1296538 RepID=A0A660E5B5_9LACO|nr:RsmF rRNA methyltransferase first C-terminal domain-containing protein [Lactiplantibacillus mudanjiangensis]VDG24424.1 RNA methyltransferase [Lactobacillus sp.] [Lactiplantibacillus mudanjiangensis]VDG28226.1 RNA methyltransferase [Lactobacillus sp.] [Lactiplantibacillus mudanjiangensis]